KSTIGKLIWHQIATVVILTQNMRQTEIVTNDSLLTTLINYMHLSHTPTVDLAFLKTLIVNRHDKKLTDPELRDVSVITSLNTQEDQINDLGSAQFSQDTRQKLTHFYSIDKRGATKKRDTKSTKKIPASSDIPVDIQNTLWNCSPQSSKHFPGKLSLCLEMPVMIRNNDATELCITKGPRGLYCWL
ncbi:hypothetical protein BYT27DRAFT_7076730, partial [Phlegmacium glaucopus]